MHHASDTYVSQIRIHEKSGFDKPDFLHLRYLLYSSGIMIATIKYAINPKPIAKKPIIQRILMIVGSILQYSPIPPHTPNSFLLVLDLTNLFPIFYSPFDINAF